eukprot:gnl/MRDRNA2_/MRDRNA2_90725_c0_seq1.p1 gnl/MRDRNA2_/MRDRNA2_90725_c0~~gnl/MRDRNA2_/MRDRNA2_90725_c0_seq1.p1  ORF type:complete len:362 (+),score=67.57 gnl/MRDRNA2_/MRDRNA2_90725_c0_seq1:66-1151(+)
MALDCGRFLLVAWLSAMSPATAETTCQQQLEQMKGELQQVQQANIGTMNLDAADNSEGILGTLLGSSPAPAPAGSKDFKEMIQKGPAPGDPHWPANRQDYVPPLAQYFFDLKMWMETTKAQLPIAGVLAIFGFVNVLFGPAAFRIVVALGFSLVTMASTHYEVMMLWPDLNMPAQIFIIAEVAALTGWIVYQSFTGAKMVLGFLFGMLVSALLEAALHTEHWPANFSVAWYSAWAVFGVLMFTVLEKYTMAFLTPIVGGFLLSSSLGYVIKFASNHPNHPVWMHPAGDCWLDFAGALLGSHKPAGIFGVIQTPGFVVTSFNLDTVLGRLLWLLIFYVGMKLQWRFAKGSNYVAPAKKGLFK